MTESWKKMASAAALTLAASSLAAPALAQSLNSSQFMFFLAQPQPQPPVLSVSATVPPTGPTTTPPTRTPPVITVTTPTPPPPTRGGPSVDIPRTPPFTGNIPTDVTRSGLNFMSEQEPQVAPGSFQFAFANCQGVTGRNRGYVVYPVRGSLYAVQDDAVIKLARGRMLVAAGESNVNVVTDQLTATIESGSSAIVETLPSGLTRVYTLTSFAREKGGVSVKVASAPEAEPLRIKAGQAAIVADRSIADEELIPVDGISHGPVEGAIKTALPGVKLMQYSLEQMRDQNLLIACRPLNVQRRKKSDEALARAHEEVASAAADQARTVSFQPAADMKSGRSARTDLSGSLAVHSGNQLSSGRFYETVRASREHGVFARDNSSFRWVADNHLNLELGTLVVHGKQSLKVSCGERDVFIDKGAVVLISNTGATVKITCVSDLASKSVQVVSGKHSLPLKGGAEVLFSRRAPSLADLYDVHRIGHRQVESHQLPGGEWVTMSQVQVIDVLAHHPLVSHLRKHGQGDAERKIIDQTITHAAALSLLGAGAGSYTVGTPDDEAGRTTVVASRCTKCG